MAKAKKKYHGECIYVPRVGEEPSEMFVDLTTMHLDRPLVNYLYAKYLASDAPARMDAAGYARNEQGQHSAADVYKFMNAAALQRSQGFSLKRLEEKYGIIDNNGERTKYSALDAYQKAREINSNEEAHVAKVVKRGEDFTVVADKKDSRTQVWESEVEKALAQFQGVENVLRNRLGSDEFDALMAEFPEMVNPMSVNSFMTYMNSLRRADVNSLSQRDIKLLLITGKGSPSVDAINSRGWGTLEETATKAYDAIHGTGYAPDTVMLVRRALTEARTANNDIFDEAIREMQANARNYVASSEPEKIEGVLQQLDHTYQINHTIIVRNDKTIKRLSDAAAEAILTLQRQLRYLQKQEGRVGEGLRIEKTLDNVAAELAGKQYYAGLLQFLQSANRHSVIITNMLRNIPDTGTAMERALAMGKALSKATTFRDGYNVIVQALKNPEFLLIDENMSDTELNALKDLATDIAKLMDEQKEDIAALQQDLTLTVAQEILGSDSINGMPIAQIVQMGMADSSIMDFLYSCERVSDPILASMGTVIRDAQRRRDRIASEFAARIEMANRTFMDAQKKSADDKDKKPGNTHFIYKRVDEIRIDWKSFYKAKDAEKKRLRKEGYSGVEFKNAIHEWELENMILDENGKLVPNDGWKEEGFRWYITGNYDWESFNKEKRFAESELRKSGVTGFAFNDEMERWMEANTIEKVVDEKSGRTERVPNKDYWIEATEEEFLDKNMSAAQKEYYLTMMQIKGEIGTLFPSYAQKQYLPPQRRAKWLDIVTEGEKRGLDAKGIAANLLDRMKLGKQREDDTAFIEGGIVSESDATRSYSSYDDTLLKQVPIYYINPLRDQSDLLMDFSGAVEGLGAIAANYATINGCGERTEGANDGITGIREIVENMADYLKERPISNLDKDGHRRYDVATWKDVIVAKAIKRYSDRTLTSFMVDGFINKHIYNQQFALGTEGSTTRKLQIALRNLLGYTSVAALSVNIKGATVNWLVGEYQMLFEGISGSMQKLRKNGRKNDYSEYYTLKDYARADAIMFGQGVRLGTVMDHLANTTGTLGHLLERRFDPLQEVYTDLGEKRYYSGVKKLIGGFNWMGMYSSGETLIHLHNMYAVLCNEKVKLNGKVVSLYDVFDKKPAADGKNAELIIKSGATTLDNQTIDDAYLERVQARIRMINQKTHGSMNTEDKGLVHMAMMGRAAMQFKQWMVEHYSRRYRGRYFDGTTRTWQEGYYNTVFKMMKSWAADLLKMDVEANARWSQLDETQKNNVTRAISELVTFSALLMLAGALGDPKEHKGEGFYRFLIYCIRRLILDEEASVPPLLFLTGSVANRGLKMGPVALTGTGGFVKEGMTLAQTPFAFTKTLNGLLYPVTGLGEIGQKYEKGRNAGKNKYWTKIKKNTLPFYGQIDQLLHMDDEDYVFNVFDNIAYNKGK